MSRLVSRRRLAVAAAMAIAAAALPAWSAPIRLDDTGTHTVPPNLRMQWRSLPQGGNARQMDAQATLVLRLDTRAWAGRSGRVVMVMAPSTGGTLQLQWQPRGRLLGGAIAPGGRTLLYQGSLPAGLLEDQLALQLMADGEWMGDSRRLDVQFELELD